MSLLYFCDLESDGGAVMRAESPDDFQFLSFNERLNILGNHRGGGFYETTNVLDRGNTCHTIPFRKYFPERGMLFRQYAICHQAFRYKLGVSNVPPRQCHLQ